VSHRVVNLANGKQQRRGKRYISRIFYNYNAKAMKVAANRKKILILSTLITQGK
jgi:hypothetical protein